ncbi:MAG: mechanosensitive ion channel domain-containing protein [Myxococcota bacterium]
MIAHRLLHFAAALVVGLLFAGAPAHTQEVAIPGTGSDDAEAQDVQASLEALQKQADRLRTRLAEWQARGDEFERAYQNAPTRLAEIKAEIAALEARSTPEPASSTTAAELEVEVLSAEQDLALAQREVADLEAEQDRRSERRRQLPELLAEAKARLAALAESAPQVVPDDEAVAEVQTQVGMLRKQALEAEVRAHEFELLGYEARGEWLEASLARATLRAKSGEASLEALRSALIEKREGEATRDAEEALASLEAVASLDPAVQDAVRQLAQENADLAQGRTGEQGLLQKIDSVSRKLTRADQRVSAVEADFQRLTYKVESSGLTDSVGLLLRKTRSEVPDVGKYRRFIRMRQGQISEVEARQDELREELAGLKDIDGIVEANLARFGEALSEPERERLAAVLRDLLQTKRKHLGALLGDYEDYFQKLVDFDARQQELIDKTTELLRFIDQRILWVPSGGSMHPGLFGDAIDGIAWLVTPRFWGQLVRALFAFGREAWFGNALFALLLALAHPIVRRRVKPRLAAAAEVARPPTCVEFRPSLEALFLSLLASPWIPLLLGFVGWRLSTSPDATQYVRSFAHGLLGAALIWGTLEVPRQLLRSDGLAVAHFGWPEASVRALRRWLGWIALVAVPLVFVIQVFEMRAEDAWRESVGRIALVALLLLMACFTHLMLREGGGLRAILKATPWIRPEHGWWRALHFAAVLVPIALIVAAVRGYYWTALQLAGSYHLTLFFLLLLLFAFQLSLRWSLLARRRIAFRQFREAQEAERAKATEPELTGERVAIPEPQLDLAEVDAQTGRLLATSAVVTMFFGLWFLWVDLVPAFGVLDGVELWSTTETVTVESTDPDGKRIFETEDRVVPVTVASLVLAVLIAFMTLVLVRNLPGLLEISIFRRLGTQPGERYAYATIAKYALSVVGGVLAFNAIGVGWSNVQWLVAAVGLGLGFGLQEIFANFISGLIILFERPIRVGDTVTVGNISGTVTKIRIRATWITSFDRKELVVPNKEFVTTQLVNWSLSDPILRVDIPVGIAYGSDTELAIRELHAVAVANEHVLTEPRPEVVFKGFGESSLDLELRVFSPDIDHRIPILHALHLAIDRAFRAARIEIAFPQRDLHLRSVPPGVTVEPDEA